MRTLVLGTAGTTGRLVAARLRALDHKVVLGVRNPAALGDALPGAEIRRCDVTDAAALSAALDGVDGVVLCAGPFEVLGPAVVDAVVAASLAYSDVSGEPRWVRHVYGQLAQPARAGGARRVPAAGGSPGLGDLLATALTDGPAREILVGYRMTRFRPSVGSFHSALRIAASGAIVWEGGRLVEVPAGSRYRRVGDQWGVLFPIPDPVMIARHLDVERSEIYVLVDHLPGALAVAFRASGALVARPAARRLLDRAAVLRRRGQPGGGMEAVVVVETQHGSRIGSATARDVYQITAELAARAVHAAFSAPAGVWTPGQLLGFDDLGSGEVDVRLGDALQSRLGGDAS